MHDLSLYNLSRASVIAQPAAVVPMVCRSMAMDTHAMVSCRKAIARRRAKGGKESPNITGDAAKAYDLRPSID